jgi:uncharacterized protein
MQMKRDDVISKLLEHSQELSEHYGIASLFLFGSVARDEARADSDVDLLVEFKKPVGLFEFIELQQRLESILGSKVDLGTKRSLKSHFNNQVLQEAIRVA